MQTARPLKKALVTGGARGIGAAICRALAHYGWYVLVNYAHSREEAEALALSLGGEAVCADVSDSAAVARMAETVGDVELVVNNAGVAWYGLMQDMTDAEWHTLLRTNTDAAFYVSRAFIPGMVRAHRGCILNMSSIWGVCGGSCEAAYSASKGALIALTKALAKELGPAGIRVNAIAPGVIETAMLAHLSAEDLTELAEETPLGRLGTPEDVGELAAFLASERAAFITGQIIGCDGGFGL